MWQSLQVSSSWENDVSFGPVMYVFVYISTCTCLCVRARYVKDVELIEFPIINNNSILNGQQKR